jgi:hypothetical protein
MSNSYRIRTEIGTNKSIRVKLEQEYDFLEILSLKFLQSEVYTRRCSDYGVVVGRVIVNDGFGVPNVKVSVFIPLTQQDESNPIISTLYPYRSLNDLNEDGYRYNLLPYVKSYSAHVPTGTFFDKEDVLINPTYIEVFDKYFKYTAVTNDSGDFMIFGVPIGTQTIHFDVDLSDIGEFSLSPQDLIRMGRATEAQVAGTSFRASTNLNELPQIISINKKIEVEPLWGDDEVCTLGITRTDVDLTAEATINITPTAIFMGSIFSSSDDQFQKSNCKPKVRQGELCSMVAGPGEILAIRQTIFNDSDGRPILEEYKLDQGGQVIDDNGTWLLDVPMNLDYVITNEFGERVFSNDPKKGIPTKGKYRFKIKWNQSPKLSETLKRGYFLVPNIREYGWTNPDVDPLDSVPIVGSFDRLYATNSYSFSLDWNDYGYSGTTQGMQMIEEAINCEDKFYMMSYNKVYTVSQLIDQFRAGYLPNRTISIKNILDDTCESENNKFPTNDAALRFDIVFTLFNLMMIIFKPVIYVLLIVVHVLAFVIFLISPILALVVGLVFGIIVLICKAVRILCFGCINCPSFSDVGNLVTSLFELYKLFTNLKIPNLTYPDCELCNCKQLNQLPPEDQTSVVNETTGVDANQVIEESNINAYLSPFTIGPLYSGVTDDNTETQLKLQQLVSGLGINEDLPNASSLAPNFFKVDEKTYATSSITLPERLNLFNVKAKYFDNSFSNQTLYPEGNNPGGGYNRIKVKFRPNEPLNANKFHYDNVMVISCVPSKLSELTPGQIVSFQDPLKSSDLNLTGITSLNVYGTPSITGTPINTGTTIINVQYARLNGTGTATTPYVINQGIDDANYAKFPIDVEYYQVITAMTYSQYNSQCSNANPLTLNNRYLNNNMVFYRINNNSTSDGTFNYIPLRNFRDFDKQVICFLVRGVDPYSTRGDVEYDLSILFGYFTGSTLSPQPNRRVVVSSNNYKLNIPIQGKFKAVRHNNITSNLTSTDTSTNQKLYYNSYHFKPGNQFSGFTTTLPSYYSHLDGSNSNFIPGIIGISFLQAFRLNQVTDDNLTYGSRVRVSQVSTTPLPITPNINDFFQNGFSWRFEFNPSATCPDYVPIANKSFNSNNNRGYFQGEIVDGGSYMFQGPTTQGFGGRPYLYWTPTTLLCNGQYSATFVANYYGPKYSNTLQFNFPQNAGTLGSQIIMRSDRLPTSTSLSTSGNNNYPLHTNNKFVVFLFSDNGTVTSSQNNGNEAVGSGTDPGDSSEETNLPASAGIIESFTCENLIPLNCYYPNNGEIDIKEPSNSCYSNGVSNRKIMENGCYVLVTQIFLSIFKDFELLTEWSSRTKVTFAACRNVFSHLFTNNWINGGLYAFAFKNNRFFTGPFTNPITQANKPFSVYCKKTIILHPTNNFYYRSSPYRISDGAFIGAPRLNSRFPNLFGAYGGNIRFLNFPTTMIDLGPRSQYLQEIVMSDDFDGYVVNQLKSTTYGDVSDILNLLIVSRLVNTKFLAQLFGANGASILAYFDQRSKRFIDGDYAQLISISSELGVADFESENYPSRLDPLQDPIYFNDADNDDAVLGIFFSSDTQIRDYISPKRTILNEILSVENDCAFTYFDVFTQRVPLYQWNVDPNDTPTDDSLFGSQKNDWFTDSLNNGKFFDSFYQKLDRINKDSRYFRSTLTTKSVNYKGYIYQEDNNGNYQLSVSTIDFNDIRDRSITVGTPFHFYFGLKKGKSAWDRFAAKWINFENITD